MNGDVATDDGINPRSPWVIGLLWSLPLCLLVGIYLSDISGWDVWLSYGGVIILLALLLVGFIASFVIEWVLRRKQATNAHKVPWLTAAGFVFLLLWPLAIYLAKPIVYQIPDWCRVTQAVHWDTDRPHPTHADSLGFALVFHTRGNRANHHFQSAYLNWSGPEPAGFSDIDLADETFSYWESGEPFHVEMTKQALRENLGRSGIEASDADRIADDIWQALHLASENKPIVTSSGHVEPIWQHPYDYEDIKLGSVVWMALLVLTFIGLAKVSLPLPMTYDSLEVA